MSHFNRHINQTIVSPLQIPPHENFEPHEGHGRYGDYLNKHPDFDKRRRSFSSNRPKTSFQWEKEKENLLNIIKNQNKQIEHYNDLVDDLQKLQGNCEEYKLKISQLEGEIIVLRKRGESEHADSELLEKLKSAQMQIGELKGKVAVDTSKMTYSSERKEELVKQNKSLKTQINNLQSTVKKQAKDIAKQKIEIIEKEGIIKTHEAKCAKYEIEIKELKDKWDAHMKQMNQPNKEKDKKSLEKEVEKEEKKAEEMLNSSKPEDDATDDESGQGDDKKEEKEEEEEEETDDESDQGDDKKEEKEEKEEKEIKEEDTDEES